MLTEKLWIVQSQLFTLLQIFVYIKSKSNLFRLSVFGFDLFDKEQIGIWSILNIWYIWTHIQT